MQNKFSSRRQKINYKMDNSDTMIQKRIQLPVWKKNYKEE